MDSEQGKRLGIALAISIGFHLLIAVVGELGSSEAPRGAALAPPVEITRVALDGTNLPAGSGQSRINSPASAPSQAFGQKYGLDAGVPMKLPVPANSGPARLPPSSSPPMRAEPETQIPANQVPTEFLPPMNQGTSDGNSDRNSPASQPSTAGNLGQKRSRGPNRVAFPESTVEPNVPVSMIGNGVANSVDVTVDIAADGSHTERIVRSSRSVEVDDLVLAALAQWKWDPAARDGQAIASTQNFKFTFKPR